jgi:hypothetical protein
LEGTGGGVAREVDGDDDGNTESHGKDGEGGAEEVSAEGPEDEGAEKLHVAMD